MDSGRTFGKVEGSCEVRVRILESSRLYHSESDSASDSEEESSQLEFGVIGDGGRELSHWLLNGWISDEKSGVSSWTGYIDTLCFAILRGLIETRRGLNGRGDGRSSSDPQGVFGSPWDCERGLELGDKDNEGVGDMAPKRSNGNKDEGVERGGYGKL